LGLFVHGTSMLERGREHTAVVLALMIPAGLGVGDALLTTALMVFQRNVPRVTAPVSETLIACWLEQNTPPDSVVMSMDGAAVAIADRRLPRGFEQAQGVTGIFWQTPVNAELVDRYHVLSYRRFLDELDSGAMPVFISDLRIKPFDDEIREELHKRYR